MQQQTIEIVPIDSIKCLPQIREQPDCDSVGGLATTIRELGIQQPLLVRRVEGRLVLTDGARRLAAARLAGVTMVPVIVEPDHLTDVQVIQRQLVANIQRKGLKPLEKAVALDDVMKRATWSAAQAAAHLGLSNAAVTRLLSLLTLPEGIRDKVAAGEISPSVAYELSRIVDSERQTELAEQAAAGKLTRDALSAENKRHARPVSEEALAATQSRATAKLALGRSVTVAASSLTLDSFIETLEEVLTRARQARPKGLALATFLKVLRDQSK